MLSAKKAIAAAAIFWAVHGGSSWGGSQNNYFLADRSSYTVSPLISQTLVDGMNNGDILQSVIVMDCGSWTVGGSTGSWLSLYDSSRTIDSAQLFARINTSTSPISNFPSAGDCRKQYFFELALSSALTYINQGGASVLFLIDSKSR